MVGFGGAYDWRGYVGLGEHPGEGEGGHGGTALLGEFGEAIYYFFVGFFGFGVDGFGELVGVVAFCGL